MFTLLFQVVKMLVVVLVTFVVTWLPSIVFVLLRYHRIGKFFHQYYVRVTILPSVGNVTSYVLVQLVALLCTVK